MEKKLLLMQAKRIFNEFDYHITHINDFNHEDYFKHAIHTLNLCDDIDDASYLILMMHFIYENKRSIHRNIKHDPMMWNKIKDTNKLLRLKNEEECFSSYLIGSPRKSIQLSSVDIGDIPWIFKYHHNTYTLPNCDYSLKYSKNKATIYKGDKPLVVTILDKYLDFTLCFNYTPYDILNTEYGFGVYPKNYIKDHAILMDFKKDHENLIAYVQHDKISPIKHQAISKIDIIEDIPSEDEILIYFIALAHFLLVKKI